MSNLLFNAEYKSEKGSIKTNLGIYLFKENDTTIAYCPALDLSAYGATEEDAKTDFSKTIKIYFDYCMNKNTLVADLNKQGWLIKAK
jgi:hypothetical protein